MLILTLNHRETKNMLLGWWGVALTDLISKFGLLTGAFTTRISTDKPTVVTGDSLWTYGISQIMAALLTEELLSSNDVFSIKNRTT